MFHEEVRVYSTGKMIQTGENRSNMKKNHPSESLTTKNSTKIDLGRNPFFLRREIGKLSWKVLYDVWKENNLGDLDVDGRIVLKGVFSK